MDKGMGMGMGMGMGDIDTVMDMDMNMGMKMGMEVEMEIAASPRRAGRCVRGAAARSVQRHLPRHRVPHDRLAGARGHAVDADDIAPPLGQVDVGVLVAERRQAVGEPHEMARLPVGVGAGRRAQLCRGRRRASSGGSERGSAQR
eukprot:4381978-Prymnesium_polylepis.1